MVWWPPFLDICNRKCNPLLICIYLYLQPFLVMQITQQRIHLLTKVSTKFSNKSTNDVLITITSLLKKTLKSLRKISF